MNVMPKITENNQEFTTPIDVIRVYPDKFKKVNNIKIEIEIEFEYWFKQLKIETFRVCCLKRQNGRKRRGNANLLSRLFNDRDIECRTLIFLIKK